MTESQYTKQTGDKLEDTEVSSEFHLDLTDSPVIIETEAKSIAKATDNVAESTEAKPKSKAKTPKKKKKQTKSKEVGTLKKDAEQPTVSETAEVKQPETKSEPKSEPKQESSKPVEQPKDTFECSVTATPVLSNNTKKEEFRRNTNSVLPISNVKTTNEFINQNQNRTMQSIKTEKQRLNRADMSFPYIKGTLMTNAEKQLYHFMSNYLDSRDKIAIFPKVRLADLIEVDSKLTLDRSAFYKISSKHVDYVICEKNTLNVICVVELDDFYHEREDRKQHDLFVMQALYTAGIQTVRIKVPIKTIVKSDLDYLDYMINSYVAPECAYDNCKMIPQTNNRDHHRFWSCPLCRSTVDIDKKGEQLP